MELRKLGTSDIEVTPIGLGCWQFSQGQGLSGGYWEALPQEMTNSIVDLSLQLGVNWFDTAESYGGGRSERSLAEALKAAGKEPGDVVIATKWSPFMRFAGSITRTIGDRLECLGGFPIDLYQVHLPISLSSVEAQMRAMAELLRDEKVRAVGVSNFSEKMMRKAHAVLKEEGFDLVSNQVKFSLLTRRIERNGVLDAAKELGITIIAYSPLEQGVLTGKYHYNPELVRGWPFARRVMFKASVLARTDSLIKELKAIGEAHGVTPAQVALNWVINVHGDTVVAIPGASKPLHAAQNAGVTEFELSGEEMERLDRFSQEAAG